ncbi:putative mitochondrial protein AtMg00310 [Silene latifolia]|uniref:putative mitochondrial protein AtMg00310 n=1 Tax=Silene latifolia TaxID=37657 RepID=UPI003D771865
MAVSVISKIDALISQFWRGGSKAGKGINWCSRLFLHSSKQNGGLGIRHSGCLNQSLLAKLGWKLVTNSECLFSRVLDCKYKITKDTVMKPDFTMSGPLSWGGRGIKWGLELLRNNFSWQVGFPSSLDVWRDKWIHNSSLAQLLSLSATILQQKPMLAVSLLQLSSGHWNFDVVLDVCGPTITPFVCYISIPSEDKQDYLFWNLTPNGRYSSKSGYTLAFSKLWNEKSTLKDKT